MQVNEKINYILESARVSENMQNWELGIFWGCVNCRCWKII